MVETWATPDPLSGVFLLLMGATQASVVKKKLTKVTGADGHKNLCVVTGSAGT